MGRIYLLYMCCIGTTTNCPHNNSRRHCGWCNRSPTGFQYQSNRTYPIQRQRKDDLNNASGSASGYRANTLTHTSTHYLCFASLEKQGSRHMCLPELLLRKGSGSNSILFSWRKHSQFWFYKTTFSITLNVSFCLSLCFSSHSVLIFVLSDQVVGPPAAGAFRERPTKPTTFRKFYERGEFPMALEHDTKGNRIAWKVGMLHHVKDWQMLIFLTHYWQKARLLHLPLGNAVCQGGNSSRHSQ